MHRCCLCRIFVPASIPLYRTISLGEHLQTPKLLPQRLYSQPSLRDLLHTHIDAFENSNREIKTKFDSKHCQLSTRPYHSPFHLTLYNVASSFTLAIHTRIHAYTNILTLICRCSGEVLRKKADLAADGLDSSVRSASQRDTRRCQIGLDFSSREPSSVCRQPGFSFIAEQCKSKEARPCCQSDLNLAPFLPSFCCSLPASRDEHRARCTCCT